MTAETKTTADVVAVPHDDTEDEWQRRSYPWHVTLHHDGRSMTLRFYTGEGWVKRFRDGRVVLRNGEPVPAPPTVADVLECVLSDAAGIENAAGSFEDWAADYGYDTDSRSAEKIYRATVEQTERLRVLLGDDFDRMVFPTDEGVTF